MEATQRTGLAPPPTPSRRGRGREASPESPRGAAGGTTSPVYSPRGAAGGESPLRPYSPSQEGAAGGESTLRPYSPSQEGAAGGESPLRPYTLDEFSNQQIADFANLYLSQLTTKGQRNQVKIIITDTYTSNFGLTYETLQKVLEDKLLAETGLGNSFRTPPNSPRRLEHLTPPEWYRARTLPQEGSPNTQAVRNKEPMVDVLESAYSTIEAGISPPTALPGSTKRVFEDYKESGLGAITQLFHYVFYCGTKKDVKCFDDIQETRHLTLIETLRHERLIGQIHHGHHKKVATVYNMFDEARLKGDSLKAAIEKPLSTTRTPFTMEPATVAQVMRQIDSLGHLFAEYQQQILTETALLSPQAKQEFEEEIGKRGVKKRQPPVSLELRRTAVRGFYSPAREDKSRKQPLGITAELMRLREFIETQSPTTAGKIDMGLPPEEETRLREEAAKLRLERPSQIYLSQSIEPTIPRLLPTPQTFPDTQTQAPETE